MQSLEWLFPELTHTQWLIHGFIFLVNIALLIFSRSLLNLISPTAEGEAKLKIFRALNVFVFFLHLIDVALLGVSSSYQNYFIKLGLSLMTIYLAMFAYSLCCHLSKKRFGNEKIFEGKTVYLDSYSTRLVDIILLVFIVLSTIYALIKIWGADSMLETTGIFGIVVAFLAFTSNIWAPDIVGGLIILNTQMLEDGDVILIDGYSDEYVISKVTLIYVILYDIRNNHRTLVRNSQFTQRKIDNLSRVASTDGIRKALIYNIGYPESLGDTAEERREALNSFYNRIDRMFTTAYEQCYGKNYIAINDNRKFEWRLTKTGDYALEYTLWIYLEKIPNTKVTATVRKHLMGTIFAVNEAVFTTSVIENINLATPNLSVVELKPSESSHPKFSM